MNIFFPPHQEKVFVVMLVFGFFIGFLYDVFKIKRRLIGQNKFILFVDDLIFSITSIVLFLLTVFVSNNGIFRWFEIFFWFIGFCLYRMTLSKILILVCYKVIDCTVYILKKLFAYPIRVIIGLLLVLITPIKNSYVIFKEKRNVMKFTKIIF